jgi:hypothetical protein
MRLYHLTGPAKVLGYIKTTLFAVDTMGNVLSFELEAYVVRKMRVPLLLGEDFQVAYELGVQRWATGHSEITVGWSRHIIPASSFQSVKLGFEIHKVNLA